MTIQNARAQSTLTDSAFYRQSVNKTIHYYTDGSGASSNLYNGIIYPGYNHHVQGQPYFVTDTFRTGSIYYDGVIYPDVLLSYDLLNDELIIPNKDQSLKIQLLKEKVGYFYSGNHLFVHITHDSTSGSPSGNGYYDNLYSGKATVLVKREKTIHTFGKAEEDLSRFIEYDHYYLVLNNRYYPVRNKGSVLSIFKDKKSAVRDFIHNSKISFKKDPEYFLVRTAEFYSQLKN
ncbi:MAG TPA: hypothetical protein VK563_10035 [Puia sp.]|nr:hypothetical protein [Puia sp.]